MTNHLKHTVFFDSSKPRHRNTKFLQLLMVLVWVNTLFWLNDSFIKKIFKEFLFFESKTIFLDFIFFSSYSNPFYIYSKYSIFNRTDIINTLRVRRFCIGIQFRFCLTDECLLCRNQTQLRKPFFVNEIADIQILFSNCRSYLFVVVLLVFSLNNEK